MKKLIVVAVLLLMLMVLSGCGMKLVPTQERAYRNKTAKMKLVKEHQILQLEIMRINAAIAKMNAGAEKKRPPISEPETK